MRRKISMHEYRGCMNSAATVCVHVFLHLIDGCKEAHIRHIFRHEHFIDNARQRSKGSIKSSRLLVITFSEKSETWFLCFQFRKKPLSTDIPKFNKEHLRIRRHVCRCETHKPSSLWKQAAGSVCFCLKFKSAYLSRREINQQKETLLFSGCVLSDAGSIAPRHQFRW